MYPHPTTLLGLVLCLGQVIHMQEGFLPKPSLRAEPGPVVPRGQSVTLVCQGSIGATSFHLEKDGRTVSPDQKGLSQDGSQGLEARFHFTAVSEDTAGRYSCRYQHLFGISSGLSESLELQVTEEDVSTPQEGPLPKPSLRAEPGPVIPRGRPVTFVCRGPIEVELFRLEKDGRRAHPDQKSVSQGGEKEARFYFPAVSEVTAGSYRCIYHQGSAWSQFSEPLQLQVTEDNSTLPSGPASRDYTVENSIRLGLVGVVLLILVAILVEAGLSQRRSPQGPQQ